MFNIANYYRNAIQNHNGILLHTDYSECNKSLQKINTGKSVEERDPSYTVSVNVDWYNHEGE